MGNAVLEIVVSRPPARFRWVVGGELRLGPDTESRFFDVAQDLVFNGYAMSLDKGAQGVFDRDLLAAPVFAGFNALDAYMAWQIQLAALKGRA